MMPVAADLLQGQSPMDYPMPLLPSGWVVAPLALAGKVLRKGVATEAWSISIPSWVDAIINRVVN